MCQMLIITRTHKSVKPTKERLSLRTRESLLWTKALPSFLEGSLRSLFPPGPSATRAIFPDSPAYIRPPIKYLDGSVAVSPAAIPSSAAVRSSSHPTCHAGAFARLSFSPVTPQIHFLIHFFKTCYLSKISYLPALCSSGITL